MPVGRRQGRLNLFPFGSGMENVESQSTPDSPSTAGARLRQAREAAGLSRANIATQTKIAERHLLAIEENRFGDLAARTYAVGFSRAYARALGLDEADIAEQVRNQLDAEDYERTGRLEQSFEPGDPARVPPSRIGWVAAAGVVVVVAVLIAFWGSFLSPAGNLPDLVTSKPAAPPSAAPPPAAPSTRAAAATGPVVMTATADKVWVKITDAAGVQLLQKELALGESWTVPQDAQGPQLRTGRPDALKFTVGGKPVPALTDKPVTMSGVSLSAADLLARASRPGGASMPGAAPAPPPAVPSAAAGSPAPQTTSRTPSAAPAAPSRPTATTTLGERPVPASYRQAGSAAAQPAPAPATAASSPDSGPKAGLQPVSTVSE